MRLLVCGSRVWAVHVPGCDEGRVREEAKRLCRELDALRPDVVIHGAAKGADEAAHLWANLERLIVKQYPADWQRDGKAAGPLRNARMLAEGKPDRGLAFGALYRKAGRWLGRDRWRLTGTGDMVARLLNVGLLVRWIERHDAPTRDLGTMPPDPDGAS